MNSPETRPSLLARLRDAQDAPAWGVFVEVYAPLIHGYLRRRGLQDADAADVTQEVLRRVAQAIRRFDYDPRRGAFRGWLFTVVRNQLRSFLDRQHQHQHAGGDSATMQLLLDQPAPGDDSETSWNTEYQRRVLRWAMHKIQRDANESTWQAFWRTSVEGKSGKEVAQALGMTVTAVYVARSRVLSRLRDLVQQMDPAEIPPSEETHV